ncbi:MAG TPA: hypothetical protein VGQ36_22400 [Thermoanaerobaculia bacterium]|jgi:hypothetical protein|nr:hypothetical protein [Thermoanaerobaculia bacterium]
MNNIGTPMKRVAFLFAALFAFAAFAATEHAVSDTVLGTPHGRRDAPSLASDGDGFLAVWKDTRGGRPALLAARISSNGDVLDPTGILLTSLSGGPAQIVWNGERYLVFFPIDRTIMIATVERDGTASDFRPLLDNASDISVATNGSRIVIAYAGDRGSFVVPPRTHVAVLDMNAFVLRSSAIDTHRDERLAPSVVALPNGSFVVAWNVRAGRFELNALPFDASGGRKALARIPIGGVDLEAKLHANGEALVAVSAFYSWGVSADLATITKPKERPPGAPFALRGRAAIAGGDVPTHTGPDTQRAIEVAPFDSQGYAGARERVLDATPDGYHVLGSISALQSDGHVLFAWVTYHSATNPQFRLLASVADPDTLTPDTPTFDLTRSATMQSTPAIAAGATESLVAWTETDGIYAARINDAGEHLDGRGIRITDTFPNHSPRVVLHDGRYAIAFAETNAIVIRYVTPDGALLPESVRIPLEVDPWRVVLASGGGTLLVAWSDGEIHATRVHPSGTIDPPVVVSVGAERFAVDPAVAWNGTEFLVAWVRTYEFDRSWYRPEILTRRVTPELALSGSLTAMVSGPQSQIGVPAVASDGTDWFVAWHDLYSMEVRAKRVGDTASTFVGRGFVPELTWTGKTLYVAYRPELGALAVRPVAGAGVEQNIDGTAKTIDLWYGEVEQIGIAARNGRWVAAYTRIGNAAEGFVPRVFATFTPNQPRRRSIR